MDKILKTEEYKEEKSIKKKNDFIKSLIKYMEENIFVIIISLSVLLFIAFPIGAVLLKSVSEKGKLTLDYYREIFNKDMLEIFTQSVMLALASSLLGAILSYLISLGMYLSSKKFSNIMRKVLLFTIISPPFVTAIAMILLFGRRGFITYDLLNLKWNIYGWQGILFIQVLSTLSFGMLILTNSFDSIDNKAVEASLDLGASPIQTLKNIIIPETLPGFFSLVFILFTMNFADFGTPVIIGGKFQVLATEAYNAVLSTGDLNTGAAMSTVMIPASILAFIFYSKMMKKSSMKYTGKGSGKSSLKLKLPKGVKFILNIFMGLFIVFNILKYATILISTVTHTRTGKLQFTLDHFNNIEKLSINAFTRSIWYSLIASIVAVIIGTALSYYIYRRNKRLKVIEFLSSLPYIIPGTFFGLGYLIAFNKRPIFITGTAAIVILNLAFRQISVSNKNANAIFPQIDKKLEMAGKDLGANRWQLIRTVIIPMCIPVFASSFAQVFTSSMTAFGAIMFLVSPGKMVASAEMFRQIKGGGTAVGSILAVFIILITGTVNLLMTWILRRNEEK